MRCSLHLHVSKGGVEEKVLLEPGVEVTKNNGFKPREIKYIVEVVEDNYEYLIQQWHETYN